MAFEHEVLAEGIEIYRGDCLEVLPILTTVTMVITDPPYGINVDTSWLTTLNMQRGKPACMSDDKLVGDDGRIDYTWLFDFGRWVVFGFPYIYSAKATGWLVWDKWPGIAKGGLGNPVEMASTNCWKGFDISRVLWAGYYRAAGEKRFAHPTQKPETLMRTIILKSTQIDDSICDFYMGSGTTGVACVQVKRKFTGIEISEEYYQIAKKRIQNELCKLRMF